jgi:KUP system potassium uptake protein
MVITATLFFVVAHYRWQWPVAVAGAVAGFLEPPAVQQVVAACCAGGLLPGCEDVTCYLGHARILPTAPAPMVRWRKRVYGFMALNASAATDFFGIPPQRVFEIGAHIEL